MAKLFRGFGDGTRLAILDLLRSGERNVREIGEATGQSQPNTSGHLACLRDCGLVVARPEGRTTYYSLADGDVEQMFRAAERIVGRIGGRICRCTRYEQ
ncbi:MAG: winged helix-turn-helix transcriptional regulator [Armatimonadetes bacterium]|nr:winged helix-turn-helix transcriptional regulator [Armatimonadota bacterium]